LGAFDKAFAVEALAFVPAFDAEKKLARPPGPRYRCSMTAEDVKALPIDRKIQIMEAIWEDFRDRFDRLDASPQQKDLLDRRRSRVEKGAAQLLDWESVKGTIGRP
jgi:putative addiction module component (TIGR02574 family)